MEKIKKIGITVMTSLMMLKSSVFAFGVKDLKGTEVSNSNLTTVGEKILGIGTTIGSVVSVFVLVMLGVKYMMGSTDEKAEYKKSMLPYVIGAVLVFAASSIASVIYNLAIKL